MKGSTSLSTFKVSITYNLSILSHSYLYCLTYYIIDNHVSDNSSDEHQSKRQRNDNHNDQAYLNIKV